MRKSVSGLEIWRGSHAVIQCTRLTLLDVSWSFGALSAANHHFPLRNHHLDDSLRRPLVSEEDDYHGMERVRNFRISRILCSIDRSVQKC